MNIILVGYGNIGQHYINGLLKIKNKKIKIYVTDIDYSKIKLLFSNFNSKINQTIFFYKRIKEIPFDIDFCIICSTAKSRHIIIERIVKKKKVKFWILEKLISNNLRNLKKINFLLKKSLVYINLPRGYDKKYQFLKKKNLKKINIITTGGNWNIASNSIHHLYLLSWLTNQRINNIKLDFLKIYKTKRFGYNDFYGNIEASTTLGSKIKLVNHNKKIKFTTSIISKKNFYYINEHKGILKENKKIVFSNCFNFQSIITNKIIMDIYNKKKTYLPKLSDIYELHIQLLKYFKKIKLYNVT
jgi:predicted dehydrogenase